MKILAVEFSSDQRSVAVIVPGVDGAPAVAGIASERGGRRALALVDEALRAANLEREQIDCLAIGLGPGSYTGIRGSIALAQGWQIGREIKLLGISSVEVLSAQAQQEKLFGEVNIVIDAQRNEFYWARYEINGEACHEIEPLRLAGFGEIDSMIKSRQCVVGPEIAGIFPSATNLFPHAETLGRLAFARSNFVSGEKLEPIYLRETNFVKAPPRRTLA